VSLGVFLEPLFVVYEVILCNLFLLYFLACIFTWRPKQSILLGID
jgi:hypothetical protein